MAKSRTGQLRKPFLHIHADDYGMNDGSCRRIEKCIHGGCLNGISVMPNGCLECGQLDEMDISMAVHLNLVEGRPLTPPEEIPLLVGADGYWKYSFFGLLLLSLGPKRKEMARQVSLELRAQIAAVRKLLPGNAPVLLDSHQHTHMIPLIFHALLKIVEEDRLEVSYLRIPAEPIGPFLREPSLYHTYQPVNIVKNAVLNFLWLFNRSAFRKTGIPTAMFCGILLSGHMDADRVLKVFPHFVRLAEKRGCDLEFLFHPGYIKPGEEFLDSRKASFNAFYLSEGRKAESAALRDARLCALAQQYTHETAAVQ